MNLCAQYIRTAFKLQSSIHVKKGTKVGINICVYSLVFTQSVHNQHLGVSQSDSVADLSFSRAGPLAVAAEDSVELLGHPNEGGPAAQFLQLACPNIGAGGANSTQNVSYCLIHWTFVGDLYCFPLRCSRDRKQTLVVS